MAKGDTWRMLTGTGAAQDNTIINRFMLRFRPIAPKPATGDSFPGDSLVDNKHLLFSGKRSKRKYVRVSSNNKKRKKRSISSDQEREDGVSNETVDAVTLQLLPERTDLKELQLAPPDLDLTADKTVVVEENRDPRVWLRIGPSASDQMVVMPHKRVVAESWVTVECVTGACMGGVSSLGNTDVERIENLERDTCPGFISDGLNQVQWVNTAYKRQITATYQQEDHNGPFPETVVWLVMKEKPPHLYRAFTCAVRLQRTWQKEKCPKMVPCDAWRMDSGGFAWRLDTKAALSLGL